MNPATRARPPRLSGRLHRFAARHPVGAILLLAVAIMVVGLAPFATGLSTHAASIHGVAGIVVLILSPPLLVATALYGTRAVWRRIVDRRDRGTPQPDGPPIEKLAVDLRRLLWQHDRVMHSADVVTYALRLQALEGAITICATQAARALDVAYPDPPTLGGYVDKPQLRRLLRALAAAGLVLPPEVGLLAPDPRH